MRGIRLSDDDLIRRDVIERLMCDMSIDLAAVSQRWNVDAARYFAPALEQLKRAEQDGLMIRSGDQLNATPMGRLLIRHLAMAFDAHFSRQSGQRYSKIV